MPHAVIWQIDRKLNTRIGLGTILTNGILLSHLQAYLYPPTQRKKNLDPQDQQTNILPMHVVQILLCCL